MDYLAELRRDRGIFVSSDRQQVDGIRAGRHKHPGVVFVDREWDREAKVALAGVTAETIKAAIAVLGSMGFRDIVLQPGLGGLY
jgi:hypothetical protein